MTKLYPKRKPYHTKHYDMGKNIKVYVEFYGNPKGFPAIYLHGGPGDKCRSSNARLFNPKKYNIILMDQRGCGKSYSGKDPTVHNTTQHLIQDMEVIRQDLNANKWLVTGGSWGASLAVLYAQAHPKRTSGLILRGFTDLCSNEFDHCVVTNMTPERIETMYKSVGLNYLKHKERDMVRAYSKKMKSTNRKTRKKYASLFCNTEDMHATSKPCKGSEKDNEILTKVDCHYILNKFFLEANQIILEKNVKKIKHIPTIFVHGRYDFICPINMAYEMHKRLSHSKLVVVKAGHTIKDKEIAVAVTKASDDFKLPKK